MGGRDGGGELEIRPVGTKQLSSNEMPRGQGLINGDRRGQGEVTACGGTGGGGVPERERDGESEECVVETVARTRRSSRGNGEREEAFKGR